MATTETPEYRVRFVIDQDARFEECNGESRPLTEVEYAEDYYNDKNGQRVDYAEYLRYYGNPDRHIYVGAIIDRKCPCCNQWEKNVESLWGIDLMDDSPEVEAIDRTYFTATIDSIPGYLREIATELLQEAGYTE